MDYYPFGGIRIDAGSFNEQRKFTGYEYDGDTGFNYAGARYYDPVTGRFISQDPLIVNNPEGVLQDPQSLNYYAYVRNNPLRYTDPTGEFWQETWQGWLGFSNSVVTNATFGIGRVNSNNGYFQAGQTVGDAASMVIGAAETVAGIITAVGGAGGAIVLSPTGAGVIAGAGVSVAGVGIAAHGIGNAGSGAYYLSQRFKSGSSGNQTAGDTNRIPDDALVCRGGSCTAEQFRTGKGVTLDANGKLQGVSVNSASNASLDALTKSLPHNQVGVTTVGNVRELGGDVVSSPRLDGSNPFHATLQGITPQQAESLFRPTTRNPNK